MHRVDFLSLLPTGFKLIATPHPERCLHCLKIILMKTQMNYPRHTGILLTAVFFAISMLTSCAPRYGCYYGMTTTHELSHDQFDYSCSDLVEDDESLLGL
jgi:hypothetical protein